MLLVQLEDLDIRAVPHRKVGLGDSQAPDVDGRFLNEVKAVELLHPHEIGGQLEGGDVLADYAMHDVFAKYRRTGFRAWVGGWELGA